MANLINQYLQEWNKDLIKDIFNDDDSGKILSLPLILTNEPNLLAWRLTNTGAYTVKSTYHKIMEEILDTSHLKVAGNWVQIWKLNVPPKIRNFIWRLQRNCVPTRLRFRRIVSHVLLNVFSVTLKLKILGTSLSLVIKLKKYGTKLNFLKSTKGNPK